MNPNIDQLVRDLFQSRQDRDRDKFEKTFSAVQQLQLHQVNLDELLRKILNAQLSVDAVALFLAIVAIHSPLEERLLVPDFFKQHDEAPLELIKKFTIFSDQFIARAEARTRANAGNN